MTIARLLPCLLTAAACALGCSSLTEPPSAGGPPPAKAVIQAATAAPQPQAPVPPPPPPPAPQGEAVTASHILVAYKGAMRADASIERSKDDAKKRAEQLLVRARKGEDFGKLADDASDDPSAKRNHGSLGRFTREQMVKPFADAAFALKPGEVSTLVETPFGFHVIKRIE
jgi:NIMA-interacting peptidyl-prolyl cis-trans isomerase 1